MTALSQKCVGKQQGSAFKVALHLSLPEPFQYQETSCLGTQKIGPCSFLCILN